MNNVRQKLNFDNDWFFFRGDIQVLHAVKSGMTSGLTDCEEVEDGEWLKIAFFDERESIAMDDSEWENVQLPHDWMVEENYYNDHGKVKHHRSHGYLKSGIGCYRKEFNLPEDVCHKRVGFEFDGIFRNSTIWVNGHKVRTHESGYTGFYVDITEIARYGDEGKNVIFIKVDATEYEGWWYEGAGIYRHVWLIETDHVHVERHGTQIRTSCELDEVSYVHASTTVINEGYSLEEVSIVAKLYDEYDKLIDEKSYEALIAPENKVLFDTTFNVKKPTLWSPETPVLYHVIHNVYKKQQLVDEYRTTFGFRQIHFDKDKGFYLNGNHYLIKGACVHQDFAGVGVALPDEIMKYKLKLLKDMGCNAYRSAHHPATPEILELCDRMGLLVMDENRRLDCSQIGLLELKEMILRGRNHPSIILWSMENEEILEGTLMGKRILKKMVSVTKNLDQTRPVIAAMNHGWNDGGYSDEVDIVGYNYGQRSSQDVDDHKHYPNRLMIGSESASCTTTRGVYERDDLKGYCPEYGSHIPEWSCSLEKAWHDVIDHPYLCGIFVWTGFDYRGEPTPYDWPCIGSHFGVMDSCGFPKDNYYYLKSVWSEEDVLHILPHWNWCHKPNEIIDVWVYSNCLVVELFLNGQSIGKKEMPLNGHLEWQVPYEAGELKAVGFNKEGVRIEKKMMTTTCANRVELSASKEKIVANGKDVMIVSVSVTDQEGHIVPHSNHEITFKLKGPGKILGVGNGDPSSHEPDKSNRRRVFNGKCLLLVQSDNIDGEIIVTATSDGLMEKKLRFESEALCQS